MLIWWNDPWYYTEVVKKNNNIYQQLGYQFFVSIFDLIALSPTTAVESWCVRYLHHSRCIQMNWATIIVSFGLKSREENRNRLFCFVFLIASSDRKSHRPPSNKKALFFIFILDSFLLSPVNFDSAFFNFLLFFSPRGERLCAAVL